MADAALLDRTFHIIMSRIVETGQPPHRAELATELGCTVEEGHRALHDLMDTPGFHGWLHSETGYIASFTPFSMLPTQHRITVEGQQKWFAQ